MSVPVIDLFAGPGGLGEGFSRARSVLFEVAVSIEKDGMAHETLRLRAAHRALARSGAADRRTWEQWDRVIADSPWNIVFECLQECGNEAIEQACGQARQETWNLEMGPGNREEVSTGILRHLRPHMAGRSLPRNSVLIGGPPCQAYSVVGRARNRGTEGYRAEDDHRHFLYREYLHVISEFEPAVFVMENVKGILTSKVADTLMFTTIRRDLERPDLAAGDVDKGLRYVLVALPSAGSDLFDPAPDDFIVRAELFGVPQARHRVIVCGIRQDVFDRAGGMGRLTTMQPPTVGDVIGDLPALRPTLSYRGRGMDWQQSLNLPIFWDTVAELRRSSDRICRSVAQAMEHKRTQLLRQADPGPGAARLPVVGGAAVGPRALVKWYRDRPTGLIANHESRAHMPADLARYFFMACFGQVAGASPKLAQFPACLLPEHRNVKDTPLEDAPFKDRFRVQLADRHSMTVTSHIAKDGHAFIHPDPLQCRALTVREAARLQTFPDSYVFLGARTSQYTQVGNAVPPYLAAQIAELVGGVLIRAGMAGSPVHAAAARVPDQVSVD